MAAFLRAAFAVRILTDASFASLTALSVFDSIWRPRSTAPAAEGCTFRFERRRVLTSDAASASSGMVGSTLSGSVDLASLGMVGWLDNLAVDSGRPRSSADL